MLHFVQQSELWGDNLAEILHSVQQFGSGPQVWSPSSVIPMAILHITAQLVPQQQVKAEISLKSAARTGSMELKACY